MADIEPIRSFRADMAHHAMLGDRMGSVLNYDGGAAMNSPALERELLSAAENGMVETLRAMGVTGQAVVNTELCIGRERVMTTSRPPLFYEPDEFGVEHIIVPVIESARTVDLLAFRAEDPERWYLRVGLGAALGQLMIDQAVFYGDPDYAHCPESSLRVFRSPLSWLRAECQGCVILDWNVAHCRLAGVREVVAENMELAEKIEHAFRLPRGPNIRLPRARAA